MSQKSRLYSAMLRERKFTVKQLADAARVNVSTVRSVIKRTPSVWLQSAAPRANVRGAPTKVYELTASGISKIRTFLEEAVAAAIKSNEAVPDVSGKARRFLPLIVAQDAISTASDYLDSADIDVCEELLEQAELYLQRARKLPEAVDFELELTRAESGFWRLRAQLLAKKTEEPLTGEKQVSAEVSVPAPSDAFYSQYGTDPHALALYASAGAELIARHNARLTFRDIRLLTRGYNPVEQVGHMRDESVQAAKGSLVEWRQDYFSYPWKLKLLGDDVSCSRDLFTGNRHCEGFGANADDHQKKILILDGEDVAGGGRLTSYLKAALRFSSALAAGVVVSKLNKQDFTKYEQDSSQYKCIILSIDSRSETDDLEEFVARVGSLFSTLHIPTYVVDADKTIRGQRTASWAHASYIPKVEEIDPPELLDRLRS